MQTQSSNMLKNVSIEEITNMSSDDLREKRFINFSQCNHMSDEELSNICYLLQIKITHFDEDDPSEMMI